MYPYTGGRGASAHRYRVKYDGRDHRISPYTGGRLPRVHRYVACPLESVHGGTCSAEIGSNE
jgi:hypothetical protein